MFVARRQGNNLNGCAPAIRNPLTKSWQPIILTRALAGLILIALTSQMPHTHSSRAPKLLAKFLRLIGSALFFAGCMLPASYEDHVIGDFGHIEVRRSEPQGNGFVVGVPHGATEPDAIDYAKTVSDATGAGIVIASGFKSKRIAVAQPLLHDSPIAWSSTASMRPRSIYPDFRNLLQASAVGPLKFYVEFRTAAPAGQSPRIEVVSAGFSFEQLLELKHSFRKIESEFTKGRQLLPVELIINPLDTISWNAFGEKNHGVLMLAERGLILRLPNVLAEARYKPVYREVLKNWLRYASDMAQSDKLASSVVKVKQGRYGRIELSPARGELRGVVIAAPHGSFDWETGELVEELSYRTSLPSVVTRGFTPTECDGWRIDVNRPTERHYPTGNLERTTERSREIYQQFKDTVMAAARGPLDLYIDIHQNGTEEAIMVATLGITRAEAATIKASYREIRDRIISAGAQIGKIDLLIEPLDQVTIGAWAAKDHGILGLAQKSLHFELPAQQIFYWEAARQGYTIILTELIKSMLTANSTLPVSQARPVRSKTIAGN